MKISLNKKRPRILIVLGFFLLSFLGLAQVPNDVITNRIALNIDQPINSNTIDCSVEKSCVNEALTGKCIKYHNDQWFTITPINNQQYYINILGQYCRDLKGVQLVVIDGIPCDTNSYEIISCVSLATQDDVFLSLPELELGHEYLLNVDGYLNDFCDFNIEFGTSPRGLPMIVERTNAISYNHKNELLILDWDIDPTIETDIIEYRVYRRESKEVKHSLIKVLAHEKNAFGVPKLTYSTQDSIQQSGRYYYKILAMLNNNSAPIIIDEIDLEMIVQRDFTPKVIELSLDYKKKTPITILVFNAQNNRLLKSHLFNFDDQYKNMSLYVDQWIKYNIHFYRIEIINNSTNSKEVHTYER